MYGTRETVRRMPGRLADWNSGIISVYFLGIFLCAVTLCSVIVSNEQSRLAVMMNMRRNTDCFAYEYPVIRDVKCRLKNDCLTDGVFQTDGITYEAEKADAVIYVTAAEPLSESLMITYDPASLEILDYRTVRPSEDP